LILYEKMNSFQVDIVFSALFIISAGIIIVILKVIDYIVDLQIYDKNERLIPCPRPFISLNAVRSSRSVRLSCHFDTSFIGQLIV
jgi:hypothetical protein